MSKKRNTQEQINEHYQKMLNNPEVVLNTAEESEYYILCCKETLKGLAAVMKNADRYSLSDTEKVSLIVGTLSDFLVKIKKATPVIFDSIIAFAQLDTTELENKLVRMEKERENER